MGRIGMLLFGAALAITPLFPKNSITYDHAVRFARYHTYTWSGVDTQDAVWNDRVKTAIDRQLTARGWHELASGGDTRIVAFGSAYTRREVEGGYRDIFRADGKRVTVAPPVEYVEVGTLHINIFDSQSKKVIWRGLCSETLAQNPARNDKKLEKAIADLFKNFPPYLSARD